MKVAIFGLGYVGLTAAACITKQGHAVLGFDVNEGKVEQINRGESPIKEPGVEELLRAARQRGDLDCAVHVSQSINTCDLAIVCVGTPSSPDGSHDMSYIAEVSRQIARQVRPRSDGTKLAIVYRSTFRPGTIEELVLPVFRTILGEGTAAAVDLVYNPEFLREAVAIHDYFHPPKIVIGTSDGKPNAALDALNAGIEAPTFYTRYREAEFTKFVDNTFHALKVAYGNELGRACVELGISARVVHEIFVSDTKLNISAHYLRPGGPFGGSCLPKDVRALQYISADLGAQMHVVESLIRSNEAHKDFLYRQAVRGLEPGARVLLLGLAFKSDSDDLRESPNIDLARKMLRAGFKLSVFDEALRPDQLVGQNLGYAYSYLPGFSDLLVSREKAESETYDLIIDANGTSERLSLDRAKIRNLYALA
jgi:GDP-mannose 6-dehydrogenase